YRFFFQAEDGIRDDLVTGVQTCALPIWSVLDAAGAHLALRRHVPGHDRHRAAVRRRALRLRRAVPQDRRGLRDRADRPVRHRREIGRASCREREWVWWGAAAGVEEACMG